MQQFDSVGKEMNCVWEPLSDECSLEVAIECELSWRGVKSRVWVSNSILGEMTVMEWTDALISLSPLKVLQSLSPFKRKWEVRGGWSASRAREACKGTSLKSISFKKGENTTLKHLLLPIYPNQQAVEKPSQRLTLLHQRMDKVWVKLDLWLFEIEEPFFSYLNEYSEWPTLLR